MKGFDPIEVKCGDEVKTIPADEFLPTLAAVEEHIDFMELNELIVGCQKGRPKLGRLIPAFHLLLNRAGFEVDAKELARAMMSGNALSNAIEVLANLFGQLMKKEDKAPKKPRKPKPEKNGS